MKLLIAIPALNEEDSIESIIERSLQARSYICRNSPITDVEITVVSDGSTDRTVERAGRYLDRINLIVFEKNRGYGAAIKEAWRQSDADILGFLDADGTCDPNFFAPLCERLVSDNADIALGCRLNQQSQMPLIRRLGNFIFATILSTFATSRVRDTASGMRVVRSAVVSKIFPLPDGLHFTPAMSARAMLSDRVKIVEIDMPYHERSGESKLRVLKDGMRFLKVILEAALLYRPSRPLALVGVFFFLVAVALMLGPALYYVQNRLVLPWMIYRFLVSDLCGVAACLLFCASYLSDQIASVALSSEVYDRRRNRPARFFASGWFWIVPGMCYAIGAGLVLSSVIERLRTGGTYEHWSRYVVMTFWLSIGLIVSVARILDYCLSVVSARLRYLSGLIAMAVESSHQTAAASAGAENERIEITR